MSSFICAGQTNNSKTDYLNVPGPIMFNKSLYNLSWTSHPSGNYYKQEYIKKGDAVDKFKSMILIDVITGNMNISDVVAGKVEELKKLKETNPVVNYESFNNPKIGEYMIDFLLSEASPDGKNLSIIEPNVYRYKTFTDKSGQKGIVLLGVSTRSYGNDIDNFLSSLKSNRSNLTNEVAKYNLPEITIAK